MSLISPRSRHYALLGLTLAFAAVTACKKTDGKTTVKDEEDPDMAFDPIEDQMPQDEVGALAQDDVTGELMLKDEAVVEAAMDQYDNLPAVTADQVASDVPASDPPADDVEYVIDVDVVTEVGMGYSLANAVAADWRWPDGIIPYKFADGFTRKDDVQAAMSRWERNLKEFTKKTAGTERSIVTFRPFNDEDLKANRKFLLLVNNGPGCYSTMGGAAKQPQLNLGVTKTTPTSLPVEQCNIGNIFHELGHTIGLIHEHQRRDADKVFKLLKDNINTTLLRPNQSMEDFIKVNFLPSASSQTMGNYDLGSIMQYGVTAFGKKVNGVDQTTMELIVPVPAGVRMGQRDYLTDGDMAAVVALYDGTQIAATRIGVTGSTGSTGDLATLNGSGCTIVESVRGNQYFCEAIRNGQAVAWTQTSCAADYQGQGVYSGQGQLEVTSGVASTLIAAKAASLGVAGCRVGAAPAAVTTKSNTPGTCQIAQTIEGNQYFCSATQNGRRVAWTFTTCSANYTNHGVYWGGGSPSEWESANGVASDLVARKAAQFGVADCKL